MNALLLIDPQNSFCDPNGELYVDGAHMDCRRLEFFMEKLIDIDDIFVTLDTHNWFHIAHPCFWVDKNGNNPKEFTVIKYKDFIAGKYVLVNDEYYEQVDKYLNIAQEIRIWPPHCIVGTYGHQIQTNVQNAIANWENQHHKSCKFIFKGMNPLCEQFSMFKGLDRDDKNLALDFIPYDTIYIAGQALSHYVAQSVMDLEKIITKMKIIYIKNNFAKRLALLRNCTSSVKGCEQMGEDFIKYMTEKGMEVIDIKYEDFFK